MKKVFVALLIVLTIGVISTSLAVSKFPDTVGTKYDAAVEKLNGMKVIDGFPDGTFKPADPVTRAQLAKLLVESLNLKNKTGVALYQFTDLTDKHWGYAWIKTAVDNNLIVGYPDNTFKPDNSVTYAECMAMILRGLNLEAKMTDKTWPSGYMNEATAQGLLNDVAYTDPNAPANRGDVSLSLYNMVLKVERQKQEEELAKAEADKKAKAEAEKNAMDFGIVTSTSYSKSVYTVKLDGDKTKYELNSIDGKTKLTDSKVEALEGCVIGYQESDDGMEVKVSYTGSSFDKAKNITKVEDKKITFKDKSTWDLSSTTLNDKYKYYTFIRVTADYDEDENDGAIYFEDVKKLGLGFESVKFVKNERVLVDDTNKVIIFLKGIDASAIISKGKISDDNEDTSDYLYGWVSSVTTKSKVDYVKIGKYTYEVYSKSSDFEEDTFVVFEIVEEGDENDIIKLVKDYSVEDLDSGAKIITAVSGTKAGSQKVTFKGDSSATDFYSSTNVKKYKDYAIATADVKDKSDYINVVDTFVEDSLSDVKFTKGDRVIIDNSKGVIVIFQGLSELDAYKNGKYVGEAEDDVATYKISYVWASDAKFPIGTALPSSDVVKEGTKYTAKLPKAAEGYTFTATPASIAKVTKNETITINGTKAQTPLEKAEQELNAAKAAYEQAVKDVEDAAAAVDATTDDLRVARLMLEEAQEKVPAKQTAYDDAKDAYDEAKAELDALSQDDPDYEEKAAIVQDLKISMDAANQALKDAQSAVTKAQKGVTDAESALSKAQSDLQAANTAKTQAYETMQQKQAAYDALAGNN